MVRLGAERTTRLAVALVLAAAVFAGCGGGDSSEEAGSGAPDSTEEGDSGGSGTEDAPTMPDLDGLTEPEAQDALADLGVDSADISVENQEYISDAGTVVRQVPAEGGSIVGSVTLVIAVQVGEVPDFVDGPVGDAEAWAEERGIEVTIEEVLDPEADDDTVVSTIPRAGIRATSELVVEVAIKPVSEALAEVDRADPQDGGDYCYEIETDVVAEVNGDSLASSITAYPRYYSAQVDYTLQCTLEWDFGRDYQGLTGTLGLLDSSDTATVMRIQVLTDGDEVINEELRLGDTVELDEDVTDVLRVTFLVTRLSGEGTFVLGDVQRLGGGETDTGSDEDESDDDDSGSSGTDEGESTTTTTS